MHVLKCAQMFSCVASKLAAGLSKQLLERGGHGAAERQRETVLGRRAFPSEERSRIKQMIKQTSHWSRVSAFADPPRSSPLCIKQSDIWKRAERRASRWGGGRRRQAGRVGEQGGGGRAIWLKDTHFNEFFSQEITEIHRMQTSG